LEVISPQDGHILWAGALAVSGLRLRIRRKIRIEISRIITPRKTLIIVITPTSSMSSGLRVALANPCRRCREIAANCSPVDKPKAGSFRWTGLGQRT
jgi:hypothetical protein